MKQNEIDKIKQSIMLCQMRMKNLRPHIDESSNLSEIYNKALIEKAVLKNKLKNENRSIWQAILAKFSVKKTKKICDYFN